MSHRKNPIPTPVRGGGGLTGVGIFAWRWLSSFQMLLMVSVQDPGGCHCEALAPWQSRYRSSNLCPKGLPYTNEIATLRSQ